ncbi:MAG: hypothetical protein IJL26_03145 [Clostridia bacterium]|nr:hypothetical protein [Clostridia bacterium]
MKKLLSVLLALALSIPALPAAAAAGYPESAHDYENDCDLTLEYIHPKPAEGLFVTFSADTYAEPGMMGYMLPGEFTQEELEAFLETGESAGKEGDRITLYDCGGELYGWYTGSQLAGKTLYLPGDRFTIRLQSDGSGVGYGFSFDGITAELPESLTLVRYHTEGEDVCVLIPAGEPVVLNEYYRMRQSGDTATVGWRTAENEEFYYNISDYDEEIFAYPETATGLIAAGGETLDLYPIECPISMTRDEVFSFTNSSKYFNAEVNGYLLEKEHFIRLATTYYATFGLTPFMPVALPLSAFMTYYYPTMRFGGSCSGIVTAELLQHYGKLDLLSGQGVDTVAELEPDDHVISVLNYYGIQGNSLAYFAGKMAIDPGTEEYSAQLRRLYDTVASGKPVKFSFYASSPHPVKAVLKPGSGKTGVGHAILLTGAYTDADGRHVLIAHDNNSTAYANGYCETLFIDGAFTEITYPEYSASPLTGFSWLDDVSAYDSFAVEGTINPLAWHIEFFRNLLSLLKQIFGLYFRK